MMRFIKFMMMLLVGVFVMAVLRTVTGAIQQGYRGSSKQPVRAPRQPQFTPGGELKKCAACGVYNAAANSVTNVRGGETVYYCSTACRAKSAAA